MLNEKVKQQFLIEFGENVRRIRKQKKLSQLDLACRINGDDNKISRIETGHYDFKLSSILILSQALEVDISDLFNLKNIKFYQQNIWQNK